MSKQCKIIEDLLPLYMDNACSCESAEMIREHLEGCTECRALYERMCGHDEETLLRRESNAVIARHEHREGRRVVYCILTAIVLLYFALLFMLPLLADDSASIIALPYPFLLLGLALLTFPYCVSFVGLVTSVCLLLEGRQRTTGERVLGWLVAAMSVGCVLAQAGSLTVISTPLTLALLLIGVARAVISKKYRTVIDLLRQKLLWGCFAALALLSALVIIIGLSMTQTSRREESMQEPYRNISIEIQRNGSEYRDIYLQVTPTQLRTWELVDDPTSLTVDLVNDSAQDIEYSDEYFIYHYIDGGWALMPRSAIPPTPTCRKLAAGDAVTLQLPLTGYHLNTPGHYRLVTFIADKQLWLDFEVSSREDDDNYLLDAGVMVINDLAELDACREQLLEWYEPGDPIVVLDTTAAYEVQALTRQGMAVDFSNELQAAIFYLVDGKPATWELSGNSSNLLEDINDAIRRIRVRQAGSTK